MGSAPQGGPKPPPGKASAVCGWPGAQGEAQSLRCGWVGSQEPHLSQSAWGQWWWGHGSRELRPPCPSSLADQRVGQSGPGISCLVQVGSTGREQQVDGVILGALPGPQLLVEMFPRPKSSGRGLWVDIPAGASSLQWRS